MEYLTPKFNLFHDKLRGLLNRMSLQGDPFKLFMIMLLYYAKICFVHIIQIKSSHLFLYSLRLLPLLVK